ncbi:MAG: tetratricopeptide repeat protein, partial [Alphaproteobacteria bacterium]
AYNNRAFAYNRKGDKDRAIADLNQAILLKPDDAVAHNNRGRAYFDKGDYDHAIADLDRAVALDPNDTTTHNNRGLAYAGKGDYVHAIADFNQSIALDPDDARSYDEEAWLLATCPDARYRNGVEAMRLASKAVQLKDNWPHRDSLAAAEAEAGRFAEAVKDGQKAIDMAKAANASAAKLADLQNRLALYQTGKPYHEEKVTPTTQPIEKQAAAQTDLKYESPRYGWSITYPADWTLNSSQEDHVVITAGDKSGMCGIHSALVRFDTADKFADFMLDSMARSLCESRGLVSETLSRQRIKLHSGQDAVDAVVAVRVGGRSHRLFALADSIGFAIDCESEEQNWTNLEKSFNAIIASFSLKPAHEDVHP